jgi:rifampicin phosphotransferase
VRHRCPIAGSPTGGAVRGCRLARRRGRPDLAALSAAELVVHARSFLPELDNAFARHDYSTLGSAVGPAMLAEACAAAGQPEALLDLISGYGEVPSASPSWGACGWPCASSAGGAWRPGIVRTPRT